MKQKLIVFFLAMVSAFFAMSQDTAVTNEYFRLLRTYNTIDEVYQAHPELIPAPPKIVINDEEVLFYNDNREVISRMPVKREVEIPKDDPNYGKFSGQIKIHRNYKVIDGALLMIWESYGFWDEGHVIAKSAKVFNDQGEFVTHIKSTHGIKLSSDSKYFASFYSGEGGGDTIFIFNFSGDLVSDKCFLSKNSTFEFSDNANLLQIWNGYVGTIEVYNFYGKSIFELNYHKRLNKSLFNFYYLSDINGVLVSTYPDPEKVFLFTEDSNLIWAKEMKRTFMCKVPQKKDVIILLTIGKLNENQYQQKSIEVIKASDGSNLFDMNYDEMMFFEDNSFIIKRMEEYYEYKIN